MKKILVKSMNDCFDYVTGNYNNETFAIISIQKSEDDGYGFRFIENSKIKAVLTLLFDDIIIPVENYVLFDEEMATEIIDFVRKYHRQVDVLIIHCYAGVSRSAAVGAFVCRMFHKDNSDYFKYIAPNEHVYTVLCDTYQKLTSDHMMN